MTHTQKLFSPGSTSNVNRGVEARENDIANIHYDTDQLGPARPHAGSSGVRAAGALAAGDAPARPHSPPSISDQSGGGTETAADDSSPANSFQSNSRDAWHEYGGGNSAVPAAVLLACPAFAALHQQSWDNARSLRDASTRAAGPLPHGNPQESKIKEKSKKLSFWENLFDGNKQIFDTFDHGPARIEVYHFEPASEYLCARDAARETRVERAARRLARPAGAVLAELLAVPRLLLAVPVHVVLQIERCALVTLRSAVSGAVQTVSDQLLKPGLALAFNALLQPPLVLATQAAAALRSAVRPAALAASDAVAPLARLLAAARLVHVERRCSCAHV